MKKNWTPEHDEALYVLLTNGHSKKAIAEMLTRAYGVQRTVSSVNNRIFRRGWSFGVWQQQLRR